MFFDSFNESNLTYENEISFVELNINKIVEGSSQDENFLFHRCKNKIKIYDRVCNHNLGKLYLKNKNAVCPLHEWELDVSTGKYINPTCTKKPLRVINTDDLFSEKVNIELNNLRIKNLNFKSKKKCSIRYLNHACLYFKINNEISFATDPWVIGSAFCNGWWLAKDSPNDVFKVLNECDFIYISHNHPDHLHLESLKHINKGMPILTAGFKAESTKIILEECGFKNIKVMNFSTRLTNEESEFSISVLKSGDFRDDSGIIFEIGEFKGILNVDSNFLNFGKLPKVDLFASSFAGGASGFPLCFENYNYSQKDLILKRNKKADQNSVIKNIELTKAKHFLPYAGSFTEKAERDKYIKDHNIKNKVQDYRKFCEENNCKLLDTNKNQFFEFYGNSLVNSSKDKTPKYLDNSYEEFLTKSHPILKKNITDLVIHYFSYSKFKDKLVLELITTSDDFKEFFERFKIDFYTQNISLLDLSFKSEILEKRTLKEDKRYLKIKIRRGEFIDVLVNRKPWEDLSIGFQCKVYRNPNIYNSNFWFHFTNIYISNNVPEF